MLSGLGSLILGWVIAGLMHVLSTSNWMRKSTFYLVYFPDHVPGIANLKTRSNLWLQRDLDFKGGLGLACSGDTIANSSSFIFVDLQYKQPPPHPDTNILPATTECVGH